ncbi:YhbY family RNA-binding protein [uncultured Eubacterium sp.]|uniref:YhbY family RNA-binding protein n=1 Tax=uncultured Eubacterium sp. TaxID=165185 RepID=UPI002631C469|nr:YhbY family RNA-binding protein [uncultured Eubacterium sp.]
MTSKERAAWRAKANSLEAIIQIGKEGITDNLITQIDDTLDVRELIKIRVHLETAPQTPKELAPQLAERLDAEVIQVIGGIIVLYREADPERIQAKKKARGQGTAKAKAKKKVKIKGLRQRQREKEAKNPYAVYDRPRYRNDRDKKQGNSR